MQIYLEVDALQQLLHGRRFGWPALPPPPHGPFGLLLFFTQHVHIDELESAHFVVQQAHPGSHGRLTDDVNHITALENYSYEEVRKTCMIVTCCLQKQTLRWTTVLSKTTQKSNMFCSLNQM